MYGITSIVVLVLFPLSLAARFKRGLDPSLSLHPLDTGVGPKLLYREDFDPDQRFLDFIPFPQEHRDKTVKIAKMVVPAIEIAGEKNGFSKLLKVLMTFVEDDSGGNSVLGSLGKLGSKKEQTSNIFALQNDDPGPSKRGKSPVQSISAIGDLFLGGGVKKKNPSSFIDMITGLFTKKK